MGLRREPGAKLRQVLSDLRIALSRGDVDRIAQLEEKMSALRPKGIAFSQAEILRAYAVQLHLKQIARLLRASRVETSRAVGEAQNPKPDIADIQA